MPSLLKSSLISVAATVVSLTAGFTCNIIAGRLLGPAGSGTIAFAIWVATSASAIADLGLPQTLLRNAGAASGEGDDWKGLVHAAFRSFILSVGVVGAAILAYAVWLGRSEPADAWIWALTAALFVSYALSTFSMAVARGRHRFGQTAIGTVIGGAVQVPLVFLGAWFWGIGGALIGHVARYIPQVVKLDAHLRAPVRRLTPEMRSYANNMWLSDLVEIMVLSRIEFLFLGIFFSTTEIGYFAAGLALAGLIEQLTLQISPALIVGFTDAHARGDRAALESAYDRVIRVVALIILPVSLGGAAIIPVLLPLFFGPLFTPAVPAAVLLMAFVWPAALCVIPWGLIGAVGHSRLILRMQIASGFLTIALLLLIVPWAGLVGAAWSRAGVGVLTLALLVGMARAKAGLSLPWSALARTILAAALCAAAASVPIHMFKGIAALVLAIPVGAVTYLIAIRLFRLIDVDDVAQLTAGISGKLPRRMRPLLFGLLGLLVTS
jgi:O-antigen/teichoic acid export membrane protein